MKKILALCFLLLGVSAFSFAQIYKGEADTKNGTAAFLLHYVEYSDYRYLFYIDEVSVFLDESNMEEFGAALDKFAEWEEIAQAERITLTKTIDSITFTSFHYNHTFFREPVTFYLVFTGGPSETPAADALNGGSLIGDESGEFTADVLADTADSTGETPSASYTLFVDTTLEKTASFRLSSKTVREMREALSPEKLSEARAAYEQQKALEELFQ